MVDYPIHIDTVSMGMSIVQLKGPHEEFSKARHCFQKKKHNVKARMIDLNLLYNMSNIWMLLYLRLGYMIFDI